MLDLRLQHVVNLREDILSEKDGPMLEHGLKAIQGRRIIVPAADRLKPRREFLAERYEMFKTAV